jgi:hypothetical protein
MVRDYWGYYVAALLYPEDSSCLVMRGPASPLACFQVNLGSLTVFENFNTTLNCKLDRV